MKKILLSLVLLLFASAGFADQDTLLGKGTVFGGFGAPVWKLTGINGDLASLGGFRGGLIINHSWIIGYGEYSVAGNVNAPTAARAFYNRPNLKLDLRYRGLEFEYDHNWKDLFHGGIYTLVGGGNVNYHDQTNGSFNTDDTVFVLEPAVNGTLNVTKWFHVGVDASWRFVADSDLPGLKASKVGGPALSLELRFGKF